MDETFPVSSNNDPNNITSTSNSDSIEYVTQPQQSATEHKPFIDIKRAIDLGREIKEMMPVQRDETLEAAGYEDNPELVSWLVEFRSEFVRQMGWLPHVESGQDDIDRYDSDPSTIHLAKLAESQEKKLAASMRLTKVTDFSECLSLEMLKGNQEVYDSVMQHAPRLQELASRGEVWDLTRLVNPLDDSVSHSEILAGVVQLIGIGIEKTKNNSDELTWVFTTNELVKAVLESLGISHTVLAQGHLSEVDAQNGDVSFFCEAKPFEALRRVVDDPEQYGFTLQHVVHGLVQSRNI